MINAYKTRGSSMVETMVALFVLGVGLLGTLSLQLQSVKANKSAANYAQASYLAHDIVEAIRSDRENAADYEIAAADGVYDSADSATLQQCLGATACSRAQIVEMQKTRWLAKLAETLPDGSGQIDYDPSGDEFVTVTVKFTVDYGDADKNSQEQTIATREEQSFVLATSI